MLHHLKNVDFVKLLAHDLNDFHGVGVVLGEDERLRYPLTIGEDFDIKLFFKGLEMVRISCCRH